MSKIENEVIPQIKRSGATVTGKLFRYLKNHFADMGMVETVVSTLKIHWLPLAMESAGEDTEEMRRAAIWAIGQLEAQINLIKRICLPESILIDASPPNNQSNFAGEQIENSEDDEIEDSQVEDEDEYEEDDEDELISIPSLDAGFRS